MNVNFDALWKTLRASREAHTRGELDMSHWDCGTAACHVGNYVRSHGCPESYSVTPHDNVTWTPVAQWIAGNKRLTRFLFTEHNGGKVLATLRRLQNPRNREAYTSAPASKLSAARAIRRLEKTLAYLHRKRNLWDTDPERMRHQEGDWGFVQAAAETAELENWHGHREGSVADSELEREVTARRGQNPWNNSGPPVQHREGKERAVLGSASPL